MKRIISPNKNFKGLINIIYGSNSDITVIPIPNNKSIIATILFTAFFSIFLFNK